MRRAVGYMVVTVYFQREKFSVVIRLACCERVGRCAGCCNGGVPLCHGPGGGMASHYFFDGFSCSASSCASTNTVSRDTDSSLASRCIDLSEGFRLLRSIPLTYVLSKSALSASSSWLMAARSRSARKAGPT